MDNSINFKGAFLIKRPTPALRSEVESVIKKTKETGLGAEIDSNLKKGVQIFNNFSNSEDVLYVVRNKYDRSIAQVLLRTPNVSFKYYPSLSTKSGFDTEKPKEAKNIIQAAETEITTKTKLLEAIRKPVNVSKTTLKIVHDKNLKLIQKEVFLDLNDKKYKKNIDFQTGICTVKTYTRNIINGTKKEHTLLSITPPGKFGVCYAKYTPVSLEEPTRRIAIKNGIKILEYVTSDSDRYMDFLSGEKGNQKSIYKLFDHYVKEAKEYYKNQLAKKSEKRIFA